MLLFVDAIGLRARIEQMADRIASWGYVVLAPHGFYRDGRAAELAPQGDLTILEAREEFFAGGAMERVRALSPDRSGPDTDAWVAALLGHATSPIGWWATAWAPGSPSAPRRGCPIRPRPAAASTAAGW